MYVASDVVAPAAAVSDAPRRCVTLIAGTGSVAVACDGSEGVRVGGWGALFDDRASGFGIARDGLACAAAAADRGKSCVLQGYLQRCAGVGSMSDLLQWVYEDPTPAHVASLAPAILRAADEGDAAALSIVIAAAAAAADLAVLASERLQCAGVAAPQVETFLLAGGLFQDALFRKSVQSCLQDRCRQPELLRCAPDRGIRQATAM